MSAFRSLSEQIKELHELLDRPKSPGRKPDSGRRFSQGSWKYDQAPWIAQWISGSASIRRNTTALIESAKQDLEARNRVLAAFARQVYGEVRKHAHPTDERVHSAFDDLFQEGMLGLCDAISHYQYKGAKFGAYSIYWIRQRILSNYSRKHLVHVPSNLTATMRSLAKRVQQCDQELGRSATVLELIEFAEDSGENLLQTLSAEDHLGRTISLDEVEARGMEAVWVSEVSKRAIVPTHFSQYAAITRISYQHSLTLDVTAVDLIPTDKVVQWLDRTGEVPWTDVDVDEEPWGACLRKAEGDGVGKSHYEPRYTKYTPEDEYSVDEFAGILDSVFHEALNQREILVLSHYFGLRNKEPKTLEEIGLGLNVTRERVRQLKEGALKKLRKTPARSELKCHMQFLASQTDDL